MRASSASHRAFLASPPVPQPITTESRRLLLLAALTSLALVVLLGTALAHGWSGAGVLDGPTAAGREWAADRPWTEGWLLLVEVVLGYDGLTVATLALAGWLLARRQMRAAAVVVAVMWSTKEASQLGKAWFGRERPPWQDSQDLVQSGSFPSAHASTVAAFGTLMVVLAVLGSRSRVVPWLAGAGASAVLLLVGADRLLLGRHYPTDLVGGALLGLAIALLGTAGLSGRQVAVDDERGATTMDDAPPVARKPVVSRSA